MSESSRLMPFVPAVVLPQQAVGDFDGDGRVDVARIQHDVRGSSIAIHLSDSSLTTRLEANVTALVERDIDQDGDVDLIATTPTGAVVVWLNNGRGEFSQSEPLRTSYVTGAAGLFQSKRTLLAASSVPHLAFPHRTRRRARIVVTRIRPPTLGSVFNRTQGLLPPFRAPPLFHS
jgi:hypothetical protein